MDYAVTRIRWSDPKGGGDIVEVEEGETIEAGTFPDEVLSDLRAAGAVSNVPQGTEADLGLIVASKDAEIAALRRHIEELQAAADAPPPEEPDEPEEPSAQDRIDALKEQADAMEALQDSGKETPDVASDVNVSSGKRTAAKVAEEK